MLLERRVNNTSNVTEALMLKPGSFGLHVSLLRDNCGNNYLKQNSGAINILYMDDDF